MSMRCYCCWWPIIEPARNVDGWCRPCEDAIDDPDGGRTGWQWDAWDLDADTGGGRGP